MNSRFSTIQYNTTVKLAGAALLPLPCFSTIQYNTTVKPDAELRFVFKGFSTIQYNTTVKPHMCGFTGVNAVALTWYYYELVLKS